MLSGILHIGDKRLWDRILAALMIAGLILCAGASGFAEEKSIVFENQTSLAINEFYLSRAGAGDWRPLFTAGRAVPTGRSVTARLEPDPLLNDILLIFDDGSSKRYFGLDFSIYNRIKLKTDRAELIEDLEP